MYNRLSDSSEQLHTDQGAMRYSPSAGGGSAGGYPQSSGSSISSAARYGPSAPSVVPQRSWGGSKVDSTTSSYGKVDYDAKDQDEEDALHTFTPDEEKYGLRTPFTLRSWRGWANGFALFVLLAGFVTLFAGYPIINAYQLRARPPGPAGFNLGGLNGSGQVPELPNFPDLIDPDTSKYIDINTPHIGKDGSKWKLVFSDEFDKPGRTFYPGDDPFFTAVDIHYWPTK